MKKIMCLLLLLSTIGCSSSKHNCDMYREKRFEVPAILGESKSYETKEDIVTYIDTLLYAKDNLKGYKGEMLAKQIVDIMKNGYEECSVIVVRCENNEMHYYVYAKADGKYVLLDPENQLENKKWFGDYDKDFVFDSYEELEDTINSVFFNNETKKIYRFNTYAKVDNQICNVEYKNNVSLAKYEHYEVPMALGPQKISDEQMSELIRNENNDKVADSITTVADAVNYMLKKGFGVDNAEDGTHFFKDMDYSDPGNLHHNDEWVMYTAPGLELLSIRGLQCSSSCTMMKYMLEGDYPEVGYIYVTGHAMLYVKADDGNYYLVQPSDYLFGRERLFTPWQEQYDEENAFCTTTLKELMDNYVEVFKKNFTNQLNVVFTYCYDGVICSGTLVTPGPGDELLKRYFPQGSNPACWYGDVEVAEFVPNHDTSQDRIIGLPNLKYFED